MTESRALKRDLTGVALAQGFAAVAVAAAAPDLETRHVLVERIRRGDFSGLQWFDERNAAIATEPERLLDGARSIVLLAASYAQPTPARPRGGLRGRVARYAWGRDYHRVLVRKARPILSFLDERIPGSRSRFVTDSAPLAERAYARAAGLGWQGKNTMLLARGLGSSFFLASILTTVDLEPDEPMAQNCGTCARCLPACPTGALRAPHELVSDRCIAFHTIENRGPIPREIRAAIGDWVFGCDLCQDACPVNEGGLRPTSFEAVSPPPGLRPTSLGEVPPPVIEELSAFEAEDAFPDLAAILALDRDGFAAQFNGRPVARANYAGLLRNACVALGNSGDAEAIPALATALVHEEPLVRGHAAWALGRLGAREPLARRLPAERDPWVREEITLALEEAA